MATDAKTVRLEIRLSPNEKAMLEALAAADDRSSAAWIRAIVKREYTEKFGDKPPKKKR